jgi:hypothetical protein
VSSNLAAPTNQFNHLVIGISYPELRTRTHERAGLANVGDVI